RMGSYPARHVVAAQPSGAYLDYENADKIYQRVAGVGLPVYREAAEINGKTHVRLRSGPFSSREEADQASARIGSGAGLQSKVNPY
ncbi:MAG: SPOR domain-containing protein, partial [Magnetococcales bacterium]|nr:SPOR domain-containing protein [Magnetococcales bacterium]